MSDFPKDVVERVALAIDGADMSSELRMISLHDGIHTYRLRINGKQYDFTDNEESSAYSQADEMRNKIVSDARATAALSAAWAWQLIETAPRDGRRIHGWRNHGTFPIQMRWEPNYEIWEDANTGDHIYDMTHWQPLPAAPEVKP